ncbi:Retrovirus-related Pol polyprotein from transposon TNT 1-94 [Dendrobium catenatum]|uniref:Retrovirus-related Pol polyprotein from transposon TNT 1-94 n=1 Tax=Dendrobium catenatum TaxID=906689 RepID=A0A2I0VG91_9ASPA|nr:Retrovirus-related Pol polyprotein from transposon TNT 1-94 [Dendrobium catenatum]
MDVKTAFLNGYLEEIIYMKQSKGFIIEGQEQKVCKLQRSIYGLKQASRSWNIRFDEAIKFYGFDQSLNEHCVYKYFKNQIVVLLILYIDDILLIGDNTELLFEVKKWLIKQFKMKDFGEASFILGIKLIRDHKNKILALSQAFYIEKILIRFEMQNSKKGNMPSCHGVYLSKKQCPQTKQAVDSLIYVILCTRPDICYVVGIVSRYQSNPGRFHWVAVKHIFKYLKRTKENMLVYSGSDLIPKGYTDADFQSDIDESKSTSDSIFILGGGAIVWRSIKQSCISDSTMKAEYVVATEAAKEAVWLRNFQIELKVVPNFEKPLTLFCDNSEAISNTKEVRNHKKAKHIDRKYHLIKEIVKEGKVSVQKITSQENIADPFTKTLPKRICQKHVQAMGLRKMPNLL